MYGGVGNVWGVWCWLCGSVGGVVVLGCVVVLRMWGGMGCVVLGMCGGVGDVWGVWCWLCGDVGGVLLGMCGGVGGVLGMCGGVGDVW